MATERGRQLLLGALAAVLALTVYWMWPGTSAAPAAASNEGARRTSAASTPGGASVADVDVHLQALDEGRPRPVSSERNLFRFKPKASPPPPPPGPIRAQPAMSATQAPAGPPPPPPVPPIQLRFIGVLEREGQIPKIAVLSDQSGHISSGPEGAIIDGRYRILKIGAESIEMIYLDGRGRQTIRLTGS